jgi:hypothetical protein
MSDTLADRLAALTSSGGGLARRQQQTSNGQQSEMDVLWEMDAVSRNLNFDQQQQQRRTPLRSSASSSRLDLTQSGGGGGGSGNASPESLTRMRELENQVRRLKTQLADEQMRNATAGEEIQALRGQLTKSQEVIVTFAQRAREDREEIQREVTRKRAARSVPSGLGTTTSFDSSPLPGGSSSIA